MQRWKVRIPILGPRGGVTRADALATLKVDADCAAVLATAW